MRKMLLFAAALSVLAMPTAAQAQPAGPQAMVSIYHAAPGEQVALLRWLADQDRAAAAAGVPRSQMYVHLDGAEWDYLVIAPVTTPAQDAAVEAAAKRLGIVTGPRAGIEFRKHIMSHTDTMARGPTSAAEVLGALGER